MSVLYSKLRLEVPSSLDGQNATITNSNGNSRTVQMSSPLTDVMLAGMDKYQIEAGITTANISLGYGQIKKTSISDAPAQLENASWSLIQQLISEGKFGNHYSVGNTKTFKINNKTYTAEVVAINDGTGNASQWYPNKTVDFICKELYETQYAYNSSGYNGGGFPSSTIKTTLNNTIYPLLPVDLKNVIISKSHSYQSGSVQGQWVSSMTTSTDKLWLPTHFDLTGAVDSYAIGETASTDKKYILSTKIKKIVNNSSASIWRIATPYTSTSIYNVWYVDTSGNLDSNYGANTTMGIPICFRIG